MKPVMRKRLITALTFAALGAAVGVVIALNMKQLGNVFGVAAATGGFAFLFGLVFKFKDE